MERLASFQEVVAVELEEALHARLLTAELLGHPARVLGRHLEEVLQAALRVVGQRVDARDVLLSAHDPHRRPALGERARTAHGGDDDALLGRGQRGGEGAGGGEGRGQRRSAGGHRPGGRRGLARGAARGVRRVRRPPPRANLFTAMLVLLLLELITSSLLLLLLPLLPGILE